MPAMLPNDTAAALMLSLLAYLPEVSHGGYRFVGEFLDSYCLMPPASRPRTMFNGLCRDECSGVAELISCLRQRPEIRGLRIVCDSRSEDRYNCFCAVKQTGEQAEVFVVFGGNYRIGDYTSAYGRISTWRDNLVGAYDSDTPEQRAALVFYDRALAAARAFLPKGTACSVTVTGHSKGGNAAQYVTVFRDSVDRCISFDGQGFSERFMRRHRKRAERAGGRIVSILPSRSIVGASMLPIPGAQRIYLKAELKGRTSALYCHIPVSLADERGRLRPQARRSSLLTRTVELLSVGAVRTAEKVGFINTRRGLLHLGAALQYIFNDNIRRGLAELLSEDALALLAIAVLRLPADVIRAIFRRGQRQNH